MTAPPGAKGRAVFCVAGTSSGVGKSSMVVGIAAALRARGLTVQAFKVGPDFIDPMHHEAATGRPSINLDSWMLSQEQVLAAFHRAAEGADVCILEGVMGLFDGRDGATEQGSTAQLAKWLGAPVVLVLDASAIARSVAAVAKGYIEFDPQLRLGGLLFNKVGGTAHTQWLRDALTAAGIHAEVLGGVPKSADVEVPERHLGLHMPGDEGVPPNLVPSLAQLAATHVDLDALLALGRSAEVPPPPSPESDSGAGSPCTVLAPPHALAGGQRPVRVAVARDAAFCFYYHDNLALLRRCGAELVFFSPLDEALPAGVAGVYLGGGYPERYAADLADNRQLRAALAAFASAGGVIYAECGGLMYLSKSIQAHPEEAAWPMVGVFPFKTIMSGRMTMGYVEVETQAGCPLFPPGRRVRGQVYHFSEIVQESVVGGLGQALAGKQGNDPAHWTACYTVQPQIPGAKEVAEGFSCNNVLASYVHLHFGNCADFAASLVRKCRSVDLAAVGCAVAEAAHAAAQLASVPVSMHSTPQSVSKASRVMQHCRSSPDFTQEERLAAKQRTNGVAESHRWQGDDALPTARHSVSAAMEGSGAHYPSRHPSLPHPHAPIRTASPAATLSKVVSMNSLSSYSPALGPGPLPPGEVLSPPLSDSPQQLSPRESEAHGGHHSYFGGPLAQQQQQQQQYALYYSQQQHAQHNGHHPPVPQLALDPAAVAHLGTLRHAYSAAPDVPLHSCYSWPRLHQGVAPPVPHGRTNGSSGQYAGSRQHHGAAPPPYAANGWPQPRSSQSRHSRSASYDRPAHGSPVAALPARSATLTPLELHSGLDARHIAMCATPYNWQLSATPSDKIVSLSPGATETLWALGLGARVAAVSDACDYPPDVVARAKARRSFGTSYASSLERNGSSGAASGDASRRGSPTCSSAAVRGAAGAAQLAVAATCPAPQGGRCSCGQHNTAHHNIQQQQQQRQEPDFVVDEDILARERPGLVVYEEQEACSSGAGGGGPSLGAACGMGQAVVQALVAVGLQQSCRVVCMRRRTLSDVLDSMLEVGEAAGVREEAVRAVDRLRARMRRVAGEAALAAAPIPARPRVLLLQSLRPLRAVGWWGADLVTLAGGVCRAEEHAGDAPAELAWEQVQAFAPDVLVVAAMRGGSTRAPLTDLCFIASQPGWWALPAVRTSAVFVADAGLFCRAGPRLVDGLECLARMLWEDGAPGCACPDRAVLKLSLRPGQRCRPRLLPNHFMPFV